MRLIYMDEAGTAAPEPVRVVASVILNGDTEVPQIISEMERIFDERVPSKIREGFIFHGKEVFNGGKNIKREEWPFEDRMDFFNEVVSLPFVNDIPIGLGVTFKGYYDSTLTGFPEGALKSIGMTPTDFEHSMAFTKCLERSDFLLRTHLKGQERAVVVAENVDGKKKHLSSAVNFLTTQSVPYSSDQLQPSQAEIALGLTPNEVVTEIKCVIDVPHFVEKQGAPLLQLADACAFSFRRFLSKQRYGDELCVAMLGPAHGTNFINEPAWFIGGSSGLFNAQKYHSEELRERTAGLNFALALRGALIDLSTADDGSKI